MSRIKIFVSVCFICVSAFNMSAKTYNRVVSLVPSLSENMVTLGATSKLVGCTSYCKVPKVQIVSNAVKPNNEKIALLKPDVILVSSLITAKDIAVYKKMGIEVKVFNTPKNFRETCNQYLQIAGMFGLQAKAATYIQSITKQVETIRKQCSTIKGSKKMFMQIGSEPIFAVLENTFMADYISILGGVNIAKGLRAGTVSKEFVVGKRPDFIFIVTMGITGEKEKRMWQKFTQIPAVTQKRVFFIPSELACQATPNNFLKTLQILKKQMGV